MPAHQPFTQLAKHVVRIFLAFLLHPHLLLSDSSPALINHNQYPPNTNDAYPHPNLTLCLLCSWRSTWR